MMKNTITLFFALILSIGVFAQHTDTYLSAESDTIKNETQQKANTAKRVGRLFGNIVNSKVSKNLNNTQYSQWSTTSTGINPDFVVRGTCTLRTDYHSGGVPVFNDTIKWAFADYNGTAYSNTLFTSIHADPGSTYLGLYFYAPKGILGANFDLDEVLMPQMVTTGSQKFQTLPGNTHLGAFMLQMNQPSALPAIRFTGDGAGSWTVESAGAFTYTLGNGQASFGPSNVLGTGSDGRYFAVNYYGPGNYHLDQYLNGCCAGGFHLLNSAGSQVSNPTTSDHVVATATGIFYQSVNLYQWKFYNNWLKDLSSATYEVVLEAWILGKALSTTEIGIKWQAVPTATGYKIYRGYSSSGTLVYSGTNLTVQDIGLTTGTIYNYVMYATISGVDTLISGFKAKTN